MVWQRFPIYFLWSIILCSLYTDKLYAAATVYCTSLSIQSVFLYHSQHKYTIVGSQHHSCTSHQFFKAVILLHTAQQSQRYCGLMGIHNLHPSVSKTFPSNGVLHNKPLHPIICRVIARLKPLSNL